MTVLFIWLWVAGGLPAVALGEMMRLERQWILRAARIAFALLLGADLLLASVAFAVGNSNPNVSFRASLGTWWITVIAGGIPLALVSGLAVRRGYIGRRPVLFAATLTTAVLYLAFPLGYTKPDHPLTGLGRFEHGHHGLDIAIMLIPTLILLANEIGWKPEEAPGFG